jgi:uncharacterized protein DUF3465
MSKASRQKHRIWLLIAFIVVGYAASKYSPEQATSVPTQQNTIEQVVQQQKSDVQLEVAGKVIKLLPDDLDGSHHQKFIIKLANGQTILVSHNIDLAPRIDDLRKGDKVTIFGEYEWNNKGGIIHWTHHDPANRHPNGWIKHQGNIYQ